MDMSMLDIFWYLGVGVCVIYIFIYAKDAIELSSRKKKCELIKGKARTCTMDRKWAYTATNVKYDFQIDGQVIKGNRSIKSVLRPAVYQGIAVDVYYEKDNVNASFLAEEIKSDLKNILVLVILGIILFVTVAV